MPRQTNLFHKRQDPTSMRYHRLSVPCAPQTLNLLSDYAKALGVSRAEAVRQLIEAQLPTIENLTEILSQVRKSDKAGARVAINRLFESMMAGAGDAAVEAGELLAMMKPGKSAKP